MDEKVLKIIQASQSIYAVIDKNGNLVDVITSRKYEHALKLQEIIGNSLSMVLPAPLAETCMKKIGEVLETGREGIFEHEIMVGGNPLCFEARIVPYEKNMVLAIIKDVQDRQCAMSACQSLLNASSDFFLLLDRDGFVRSINEAAAASYGKTPEAMEGTHYWDHLTPERESVRKERFRHILESGEPARFIDISEDRIYEVSGNPAREADGSIRSVAFFVRDITDSVKSQQEIIESDARHRRLFEDNPVPMYIYDTKSLRILDANISLIQSYGYTKEELTQLTISDIRPPEDVSLVMENVNDLQSKQVHLGLWRHTKKDGTVIDVEITSGDFPFMGRPARLVLCNDVTEQIQARRALEESETKFRSIVQSSPMGIHMYHLNDRDELIFSGANPAADRILGIEHNRFIGHTMEEVFPKLEDTEIPDRYRDVCIGGAPWQSEQVKYEDEKISGIFEVHAFQTAPRVMAVLFLDITEKKSAEVALVQSEEQLRASLGEKEMLLKEIHHRVKNNLQVISGLLDLQAHHISDPMGKEIYKESQNRVITMALIHEALYQSVNLSQVDFADYIRNLCENLMISYGADRKRIKLEIDTQNTEMVVDTAIPCGLIINELITNSLKHGFPGKRRGTISLSFRQMKNKNYLLTVSDDGVGIPRGLDLGGTETLGMQLVTVLVGQLGGSLKVSRKEGTRFTIKFKEYHEAGSVLY